MHKGEKPEAIRPGQRALWSFVPRGSTIPVSFPVTVLEARRLMGRVDYLLETDAGSTFWASDRTVRLVTTAGG